MALPASPSKPPIIAPIIKVGAMMPTGRPTPTQAAVAMVLATRIASSAVHARWPSKAVSTVS